jgi:hypothetical protein
MVLVLALFTPTASFSAVTPKDFVVLPSGFKAVS